MKIGDIIETPDGKGTIHAIETYSKLSNAKRYCVKLNNGAIKCYWEKEVTIENNSQSKRP